MHIHRHTPWGMKFVKAPDFMTTQFKNLNYVTSVWLVCVCTLRSFTLFPSIQHIHVDYVCVYVNNKWRKMDIVNCFKQHTHIHIHTLNEKLEAAKKWLNFIHRPMKFIQLLRRRRGNRRRRKRRKTKSIALFHFIFFFKKSTV